MINENILKLDGKLITVEQLNEIEGNENVTAIEDNGMSGNGEHYNQHWYSIIFKENFIGKDCDDIKEIQVYTK